MPETEPKRRSTWRTPRMRLRIGLTLVCLAPSIAFGWLWALFWLLWLGPFAYFVVGALGQRTGFLAGLVMVVKRVVLILAVSATIVATLWSYSPTLKIIEWRMAPLIAAIDRFHQDQGAWPQDARDIVPRYLAEIPACPYQTAYDFFGPWGASGVDLLAASPDAGSRAPSGPPILTCGTLMVFLKYSYTFANRAWYTWD